MNSSSKGKVYGRSGEEATKYGDSALLVMRKSNIKRLNVLDKADSDHNG